MMLTTRKLENGEFTAKDRKLDTQKFLMDWRKDWAAKQNQYLERAGHNVRVDHRSLKDQGIDRIPQKHLGKEVMALERKGIRTEKVKQEKKIGFTNEVDSRTKDYTLPTVEKDLVGKEFDATPLTLERGSIKPEFSRLTEAINNKINTNAVQPSGLYPAEKMPGHYKSVKKRQSLKKVRQAIRNTQFLRVNDQAQVNTNGVYQFQ